MFAVDGWQAAILTSGPLFGKLSFVERHLKSYEMFVLLSGEATLYQGETPVAISMTQGRLYNVRNGTWHGIAVEPGGRVLVVENNGDAATEKKELLAERNGVGSRGGSDFQQLLPQGDGDGFGAVGGAELRKQRADVLFNAVLPDVE